MLPLSFIRENKALVQERLGTRSTDIPLNQLLELDDRRRVLLSDVEQLRAKRNDLSKNIGKSSDSKRAQLINKTREVSDELKRSEPELAEVEARIGSLLLEIPMLPDPSVPIGNAQHPGTVHFTSTAEPTIEQDRPNHVEIAESLGILDFARSSRISGSGFWMFMGVGAQLQRALISWLISIQTQTHGYRELYLPALVTGTAMTNAGKLPKFAGDSYRIDNSQLWLSPTAEVALSEFHAGETLDANNVPARYVAYSPAFRREAGSAGTETRGLRRVHQFDKVELFQITAPEKSYAALEEMRSHAETALKGLELPYRVREVATGDLGFSAAKQYDLEVWSPGAADWLEVSSISNCEAFQTRRAGIRLRKPENRKTEYAHSLNGTALGLPRTFIALLETGFQKDGTVRIPEVLQPYLDNQRILKPEDRWL
ncbi:MAG: serine--tRNA ligase [Chloroflexi bacterium]|nr:serine--tRNA ligase [Chloroflexota bacterium]HCI86355.1 serine--tRNA ligase [Dehalococcoidia bacterium]